MAKKKVQSAFFCQNCGTQSPKWLGKCPQCNEWNTFVEEVISKEEKSTTWNGLNKASVPVSINNISFFKEKRIKTSDIELNRVLVELKSLLEKSGYNYNEVKTEHVFFVTRN